MEKFIKQVKEEDSKGSNNLSKIDKKSVVIGLGVIGALGALTFFFGGEKTEVAVKYGVTTNEVKETVKEVVSPVYKEQKEIRKTQEELTKQITALNQTLADLKEVLKEKKQDDNNSNGGMPPIDIPNVIMGEGGIQNPQQGGSFNDQTVSIEPPKPKMRVITVESIEEGNLNNNSILTSLNVDNKEDKLKKKEEESPTVYIPAGSIAEGRLMYGFIAPESGMFPPVLLEFTKPIRTANGHFIPLQKCLITTSAQYDLSQGVAILGGIKSKLSCVLNNGRVVEKDVNIAVGEEKKGDVVRIGLTGKEQWLTGKDFATITSLVSISGMASSYKQGLIQQSITPQGNVLTAIQNRGLYSILGGVNEGVNRFVDFWMKKYDRKVPAIKVNPKDKIFIVFVDGVDTGIKQEELM